jgi:hypothetical protein
MTIARRIVHVWPSRAGRSCVAGARHARGRALAAACLGTTAGFAFGSAILVGAPAVNVGGASSTAGERFDGPGAPSAAHLAPSVAAVLAPAPGAARPADRGRGKVGP